ncbi:undecaprenyldiphospho-muramoylpentapeptide beta-N-acetylglucosaminyltransferase [Halothiobacillus sp. DCM-1]|uniref:undecaprenyldiphospho-muramoylpentapeptide beta-N-acetylglucosaminyltransferase n=1 Tax=Halothiobacillus sp. DCM-1 TaxID=3112558 RepID=UPI0032434B18
MTTNAQDRVIYLLAGGTGGHVVPALTVAKALAERGFTIRWLGTAAGIEAKLVPAAGFALDWLDIGGLRGKSVGQRLVMPLRLLRAAWVVRRLFLRHRPVLVIGMGGYAAGPGGLMARWLGIPLIIHEQNAIAGWTNRWLAPWARQTLAAYVGAFAKTPPHLTVVGNPVRPEITQIPPPDQRGLARRGATRVLVLGGSLGAQAINEQVPVALARIAAEHPLDIRHQTGVKHLSTTQAVYDRLRWSPASSVQVQDFIGDMAEAYAWADFVIARAGALTVAEIAVAGVGALFIPFPHAVDDHQTKNAQPLVQAGAAVLVPQAQMTVESLFAQLSPLLKDEDRLREMARAARQQALPKATETVVRICLETLNATEVQA